MTRTSLLSTASIIIGLGLWGAGLSGNSAVAQVPGPEIFAKAPQTPLELWDAIDYLVRTEQASKAVPYLDQFMKSQPNDEVLVEIRQTYGFLSIFRLQDFPPTRKYAEPIVKMIGEAGTRITADPKRVAESIALLSSTRMEQNIGVEQLRQLKAEAIPAVVEALKSEDLNPETRALIVKNLGRLGRAVVPPLNATLDAQDQNLAAEAAEILGRIGDARSLPWLTLAASRSDASFELKGAAASAIEKITKRPLGAQTKSPVAVLIDEARRYQKHQVPFRDETETVWSWNAESKNVESKVMPRTEAEAVLGGKLADAAVAIEPGSKVAKAAQIGLQLDKAIEKVGVAEFPKNDPDHVFDKTLKAGPEIIDLVLKNAIADGNSDLAAFAAQAYGQLAEAPPETPATDE